MISFLKKCALWYFVLTKRLVKKISFIIILFLIPVLTLLMIGTTGEEKGLVRVALAAESPEERLAQEMLDELNAESKLVLYTTYPSADEAISSVRKGNAEVAWVLASDLEDKIAQNVSGDKVPLVNIYASEDNILIKATRELMFSKIYSRISYNVFKNYVSKLNLPSEAVTDEILYESFYVVGTDETLMEFEFKGAPPSGEENSDYLLSPLRGLLATIMLLCGMAASMYYLNDEQNKVFSSYSVTKRSAIFMINNISALVLAACFVTPALAISDNYNGFWLESTAMLLYIVICSGFCMIAATIAKSPGRFSVLIPLVLVLSVVFTPVIFNIEVAPILQVLLPTYLYLFSVSDPSYLLSMAIYAVSVSAVSFGCYCVFNKVQK